MSQKSVIGHKKTLKKFFSLQSLMIWWWQILRTIWWKNGENGTRNGQETFFLLLNIKIFLSF